jgi:hypothetical protein
MMMWNALLTLAVVAQPSVGTPAAEPSFRGDAILASMALPGVGQMMLGSAKRGEALLWLDGAIWALWSGFSWYSSSREHSARLFAGREAGADLAVKDLRYYRALEQYDNADQYNEGVRADARDMYPDDPERQHQYYQSQGYFGAQAWNWSSDSARFYYWGTRRSGRTAALNAQFAVGALVLNRLASLVDCAFFAGRDRASSRVEFRPGDSEPGIKVCLRI